MIDPLGGEEGNAPRGIRQRGHSTVCGDDAHQIIACIGHEGLAAIRQHGHIGTCGHTRSKVVRSSIAIQLELSGGTDAIRITMDPRTTGKGIVLIAGVLHREGGAILGEAAGVQVGDGDATHGLSVE